jgi:hypothetical protein
MRRWVTVTPARQWLSGPPREVTGALPVVGTPSSGSFQRISAAIARSVAWVAGVDTVLPITAIPVDWSLNPPACAPRTGRSIPPARPSKIVP